MSSRCNCLTLKGVQCKNNAKPNSEFCGVHKACSTRVPAQPSRSLSPQNRTKEESQPSRNKEYSPRGSASTKASKPKLDIWNRPEKLPWPNYEQAYKLLSDWEEHNRWDSKGMTKKNWNTDFTSLRSYEPWSTFLIKFADYLKDDKDFKQLYENGWRDTDGKITPEEVVEKNLAYFATEFKQFLEQQYGIRWKQVSGEKEGKLVIMDYSTKPAKYFELIE